MVLQMIPRNRIYGVRVREAMGSDAAWYAANRIGGIKPGSLFPALHRLEASGHIAGEWTASAEGRRVKAYRLTTSGRRQLAAEKSQWARVALAVTQILEA